MPENFFPPLPPSDFPDDRRRQWLATEVGNTIKNHYTATVIVAASDSKNADSAHHRCDGGDDQETIQKAVNALPSGGGHIHFLDGTFYLSDEIEVSSGDDIRLTGEGWDSTKLVADSGFAGGHFFQLTGGSLELQNLTLDGQSNVNRLIDSDSSSGTSYTMYRVRFIGSNTQDFTIGRIGSDEIWIVGCHFLSTGQANVTFGRESGGHVIGCRFDGSLDVGGQSGVHVIGCEIAVNISAGSLSNSVAMIVGNTVGGNVSLDGNGLSTVVGNHIDGSGPNSDVGVVGLNVIGGTAVTGDHGVLDGLDDDDHTQYLLRSILTTRGDLPFRNASDWARLAIGSAGQFLKAGANDPEWATLVETDISDLDHDDADAVHDNVAGEIAALTQVTAAGGDHILIEDASDSNNKKRVSVTSVQSAGTAGEEFDYAEITSNVTISGTSEATANTIITGTSQAYEAVPTLIEVYTSRIDLAAVAGGNDIVILLYDGSTVLGRIGVLKEPEGQGMLYPFYGSHRLTPTAATHQYIVKAYRTNANGTWIAGSGGSGTALPSFLRVTRI